MIEVLWIDDECKNQDVLTDMGKGFVDLAYVYGIKITPMLTYKEGIDAIKKSPLRWSAVILDIHNQKATTGKASDDFDDAREQIISFKAQHNQREPYIFVLSGNKQYQTEHSTIRKPNYCQKNIYDKSGEDYKILFKDILKIKNLSDLYKCQEQYKDVLKIAKHLSEETWEKMMGLLLEITVKDERKNADLINRMRKVLENVMTALKGCGYKFFTTTNEGSLNELSVYIGKDETIPIYIQRAFHTLTNISQDGSHSESISHKLKVDYDVSTLKAPYLLRSCLYELCNILIWIGDRYNYAKND